MSERLAIPVMPWANRRAESFTDVEVEAWKAQIPALQEQLSAYSVRRSELRAECIRLARLLAPDWDRGRLVKHLERNLPKGTLTTAQSMFEDQVLAPRKRIEEAKEKVAKAKQAEAAQDALVAEAIVWLQAKGKSLGTDFTPANAVAMANDIAAQEAIDRRTAAGGFIDFSGQNCEDECAGWDMVSRRCECGNRRVSWETGYGHSFKEPYIYAEAY